MVTRGFEGKAAIGYEHGYDEEIYYLGLALVPTYVERFVECCLESIGEDDPDEGEFLRGIWEDGNSRAVSVRLFKAPGGQQEAQGCHHHRAKDKVGNTLTSNFSWTFTTGSV